MTIIYLAGGWLAGILWASWWDRPLPVWLLLAALSLITAVLLRQRRAPMLLLIILLGMALGGARYTTAVPSIDTQHVAFYNDSGDVTLLGVVAEEPDVRDRSVNLRFRATQLTLADGTAVSVQGEVLVRTARFPVIPYGAELAIEGQLEAPPELPDFNYRDYLARQGIHTMMNLPAVTIQGEGAGHPLRHAILAFKAQAQSTINRLIRDPEAALLRGILLGDDSGIPATLADDFRTTGMTHIIAISGFNIALLVSMLLRIGEPLLGKRGSSLLAMGGVALYTVLVGADASVVRAAVMGSLSLIGNRWLGRPNYALASLLLAAWLMTLADPFTLWDVGFQLSFAATLSLMLYAQPLSDRVRTWLQRRWQRRIVNKIMALISEALLVTLAAQLLTLPLIVLYFDQLSLISLLANAVILPAQPGVMVWGGLATVTGLVWPALGHLLAWVAWIFLTYTISLVHMLAAVPGAAVSLQVAPPTIFVTYVALAAMTWLARQEKQRRAQLLLRLRANLPQRLLFGGTAVIAALTLSWGATQPDGLLHVVFFDVGQGDAIFIQSPSGRQILVDGGFYPSVLNAELGRRMPFWDREIDMLVATHPDADHVSGLVGVLDRYDVSQLLTNGQGQGESEVYDALLAAAATAGTAVHPARAGEMIAVADGLSLQVLHPGPELNDDRNENSVSLRLVYGEFSLLLTGDAEGRAERRMLAGAQPLSALVFKAGHHGSRTSSTQPFWQAVRPHILVISAGADNRFGHPHQEVLDRAQRSGTAVLRTDELGTVAVTTDGHTMWWQAENQR